ncbi:pentapeptide repeat-containing protein [Novosphingobium resinovorum]|jgi:hypothetical protein|uniref:pentapeptide repeat-containing protein n=1 Tax=Novosphingobium resinovorum TaxID=158500 RepID=UPI0012EAF164|nr:pentapeptide repeat-containing protein [Novosphingobium resinovorum]
MARPAPTPRRLIEWDLDLSGVRFERCSMPGVRVERALLIGAMFHGCRGSQRLVRGG